MESRKMVLMNLFAGQQWRNRFERTDLWTQWGGEEGEGEMYGERNMETYNAAAAAKSLQSCPTL